VLDTSALEADLSTIAREWLPAGGDVTLSVHYDTMGTVSRLRLLSGRVESSRAASFLDLVRARLLPQPPVPGDRPYRSFRLRIETRDAVSFEIQPSKSDPPRLLNKDEVERLLAEQLRAGMRGEVVVELFVNVHGAVERSRIYQSALNQVVDAAATRIARTMIFDPARMDGYPIPTWVRIPVNLRAR
jgi:TonB family protein